MTTGVDSFRLENALPTLTNLLFTLSGNGSSEDRERRFRRRFAGCLRRLVPVADAPTPSVPAAEVNRIDHDDRSVALCSGGRRHVYARYRRCRGSFGEHAWTCCSSNRRHLCDHPSQTEYSGTDPAKNPGLPAPAAKSKNEIPVSIVKFLKEREETERARRNQIIRSCCSDYNCRSRRILGCWSGIQTSFQ
jgi:hypothetical protein